MGQKSSSQRKRATTSRARLTIGVRKKEVTYKMMIIKARFLEARELPARDPFPASTLLNLLVGSEPMTLVGGEELYQHLDKVEELTALFLELKWKRIELGALNSSEKGNAYRLRVVRFVDPKELVS